MLNNFKLHIFIVLFLIITLISCVDQETDRTHPGLAEHLPDSSELNFLIVSFDALRADGLGFYGYDRDTSPNLDAFAEESLVFDHAYTASNTTPTSFASAFTGQYPYRVFIGWKLIPTDTLAALMRDAGFYTFGLLNNVQLVEERNFQQGFDYYSVGAWKDERVLEEAKTLLEEARDRDQQFFGWIHFLTPHTPYEYRDMSAHLAGPEEEGRFAKTTGGEFEIRSDDELKRVRDLYDGEIYFGDDLFGQLLAHMDHLGLSENTVIIVTSDHGEEFMDHDQVQHNSMYEELIHIPMLIRHPGMTVGARTDARYVSVDLMPTILGMAGLEPPEHIDGIDLFNPFNADRHRLSIGMTNAERKEIVNEKNKKKLILSCEEFSEELYDLASDPEEKNNLILDEPHHAGSLYDAMEEITVANPCTVLKDAGRGKAPEELLTPEQIEQLRSLGYIQ